MKLSAVMPALVALLDADCRVDFGAFEQLLTDVRDCCVIGWMARRSTGEIFSQTPEERRAVLEFVKECASDDEILIAGANVPAKRDAIEQTALAKELGYDDALLALRSTPPETR